ncbi:MAG: hypothetical protein Tsb0016_05700 [Sphingomonadales bacterium]
MKQRLAAMLAWGVLAVLPLPAQADDQCLSPAELRAFTTLLVDRGSEAIAARCADKFPAASPFAAANYNTIMTRFDDRRLAAYEKLLAKFAPVLAGSAGMTAAAAAIISPIIDAMVAEGMDEGMTAERCAEMDGMMEALHVLDDAQIIAVTEVLMRRNLAQGDNPNFKPCPQP